MPSSISRRSASRSRCRHDGEHGDLIHADRHGAVVIPAYVLEKLPGAIELCTRREAPILKAARSSGFSMADLRAAFAEAEDIH